ncbi:MAG TPA: GntR family transcriptional regulator [Acidobacteriaceae bacterium]|nr:GntR family transcriptional regulator [Acidobacteriaceae bacterium]
MPTFAEIEPLSLSDRVINALKDAFFAGELKPGDAIVERELARQMKVGTPVVREALIALQGQGFVRRVTNTGTFVTQFSTEEVRQLYTLRVELELLALQWAKPRVTENDLKELSRQIARVVEEGERGDRRQFLELDYAFHKKCWALSGNTYLAETLDRLMAPLFTFVVLASGAPLTGSMGREHYELVNALQNTEEPEFTEVVRKRLIGITSRWLAAFSSPAPENPR